MMNATGQTSPRPSLPSFQGATIDGSTAAERLRWRLGCVCGVFQGAVSAVGGQRGLAARLGCGWRRVQGASAWRTVSPVAYSGRPVSLTSVAVAGSGTAAVAYHAPRAHLGVFIAKHGQSHCRQSNAAHNAAGRSLRSPGVCGEGGGRPRFDTELPRRLRWRLAACSKTLQGLTAGSRWATRTGGLSRRWAYSGRPDSLTFGVQRPRYRASKTCRPWERLAARLRRGSQDVVGLMPVGGQRPLAACYAASGVRLRRVPKCR